MSKFSLLAGGSPQKNSVWLVMMLIVQDYVQNSNMFLCSDMQHKIKSGFEGYADFGFSAICVYCMNAHQIPFNACLNTMRMQAKVQNIV